MSSCRFFASRAALGACLLGVVAVSVQAQNGLAPAQRDDPWLGWQARITLQTGPLASAASWPLTVPGRAGTAPALRGIRGAAVFGDYVFARYSLGSLRATGGLVLGSLSGAPLRLAGADARLGLGVFDSATIGRGEPAALPYIGLGYSSPALWGAWSVTADFGLVAARPSGLNGVGRALLGPQATDAAPQELRLAPMLQLGVRHAF